MFGNVKAGAIVAATTGSNFSYLVRTPTIVTADITITIAAITAFGSPTSPSFSLFIPISISLRFDGLAARASGPELYAYA